MFPKPAQYLRDFQSRERYRWLYKVPGMCSLEEGLRLARRSIVVEWAVTPVAPATSNAVSVRNESEPTVSLSQGVEDSSLGHSEESPGCNVLSGLFQANRIGGGEKGKYSLLRNNCTYLHPNPSSCGTLSLGR